VHGRLGGDPVHEAILQMAFDQFNQEYAAVNAGQVAFSQHTINLFIYGNIRTDLFLDSEHQYFTDNHFDNPNDGPLNSGEATWFTDALNTINNRRQQYGNVAGEIRSDICPLPGYEPTRQNPDITEIVENFGLNTHTLADFYAHSNWVDEATRGGYYIQERYLSPLLEVGGRVTVEEGTVPNGLAMTTVWDEQVDDYDLYSGQVNSLIDIFGNSNGDKVDVFGQVDMTTHAYWEKDGPPGDQDSAEFRRFEMARTLAIEHTLQEIRRLWAASENNIQLRNIYSMGMEEKQTEGVQYSLEGCLACPAWGNFDDVNTQIDYVTEFVNDNNW
jgi:hypothetical protein